MSGLEPCVKPVPTIVMGEDKILDVKLKNATTKDYLDITSASEIVAILLNADGTFLEKKLSTNGIAIISGPSGHFQINLASSETALLAASGDAYSDIEVKLTLSSKLSIVNLIGCVNIVPSRYPTAP